MMDSRGASGKAASGALRRPRPERPADPVRVAIANKNSMMIRGLRSLLTEDGGFETVVSATDGELFLECVERMDFDIGIIGWVMPYRSGQQVLEALLERPGTPRIVVYSGDDSAATIERAMALGAAGFCPKSAPPEQLLDTLHAVARGHMLFPLTRGRRRDPLASLTAREREVLQALAEGKTNAALARHFGVSANTIKFHLRNLYEKLGVQNRAGAVAMLLGGRPA